MLQDSSGGSAIACASNVMNSQLDIRVPIAIFMALGGSGCTLLFQETATSEASDAGPAADADPEAPDASDICMPHICDGDSATRALYHFEPGSQLIDACADPAHLVGAFGGADSQAGLGRAAGLRTDSSAGAIVGVVTASWTVDFWLSPRPTTTGELLTITDQAPLDTNPCGLRLAIQDGNLEIFKYLAGATNIIGSAPLGAGPWHHVVMTYDHSANSADLSIDGTSTGELPVGACNKSETVLTIGYWQDTGNGAEVELDELRLQEGVVFAAPCAASSSQVRSRSASGGRGP